MNLHKTSIKLQVTNNLLTLFIIAALLFLTMPISIAKAHPDPTGVHWDSSNASYDYSDLDGDWRFAVFSAALTWSSESSGFYFYQNSSSINGWHTYDMGSSYGEGITIWSEEDDHFTEVDSFFNTYYDFDIDDDTDVETVALHEFGHWLQLDNIPWYQVWHSDKVMYATYQGVRQELTSADIDGLQEIYGE